MIPATHRRCFGGGGLRLGKLFPTQVAHDTGHTQAVLLGRGVKIEDTFPNPGVP